jgi:hypothetical protein
VPLHKFREACLTCPMFLTTSEFLPQHRAQRHQTLELITAAEARDQQRLAEMNRTVLATSTPSSTPSNHRKQPNMRSDNSIHLTTAAKRRHELTRAKAIAALHDLDRAGAKITFEAVADHAGVSRSWLYTQSDLKDEIRRLRARNQPQHATPTPARQRASDDSVRQRLDLALRRNRELATENQQLRRQLAHALGQLRDTPPRTRHDPITIGPC